MLEFPNQQARDLKQRNTIWLVAFVVFSVMVLCASLCFLMMAGLYNLGKQAVDDSVKNIGASDVVGVWKNDEVQGGIVRIQAEKYRTNCFIMVQVSDESATNYPGEVIGEFCYDAAEKNYSGRHLWGGGKSATTEWGEDDGLLIELTGHNRMFLRFLDSQYSDGWEYARVMEDNQ